MKLDYQTDGFGALLVAVAAGGWITEEITAVFRAVPGPGELAAIVPAPGTIIWTPPEPALLRGVTAIVNVLDPLVAAGGATVVSIGSRGVESNVTHFVQSTVLATWNNAGGRTFGWGRLGPQGASLGVNTWTDGGVSMLPANAMVPTQTALTLAAFCDAGSVTGTIVVRIQWRPF